MILGDNGRIFRLVGINGVAGGSRNSIMTTSPARRCTSCRASSPRSTTRPATGTRRDKGAADVIHGEAGNDLIHGQTGNDVIYGEVRMTISSAAGEDFLAGGTGDDGALAMTVDHDQSQRSG